MTLLLLMVVMFCYYLTAQAVTSKIVEDTEQVMMKEQHYTQEKTLHDQSHPVEVEWCAC